jgi:two-component system chemotaxis response regulator CheB
LNLENKKIRVLVVDDSIFMQKILSDILNADSRIEVIDTAKDGLEAIVKARDLTPDVITLDIHMPDLDGKDALKRIMSKYPTAVVLVSAYTQENAPVTLECLALGAVDFVAKPSGEVSTDMATMGSVLIEKVVMASKVDVKKNLSSSQNQDIDQSLFKNTTSGKKIVVIGASTGGPGVIENIISQLTPPLNLPVVIAQHMPAMFTKSFAERLNKTSKIPVKEASLGEEVLANQIYIAPGNFNVLFEINNVGKTVFKFQEGSDDKITLTPSVDELFTSAADKYGSNILGIILTGMGMDGVKGTAKIKEKGGKIIVQDESSSLIYGMPREIVKNGHADEILSPEGIAKAINIFGHL